MLLVGRDEGGEGMRRIGAVLFYGGLAAMAWLQYAHDFTLHGYFFPGEKYRAEVGYHDGSSERWWFGRDTDRATCTREATQQYNTFNSGNNKRAFSWACLVIRGDRVLGRVR